MEGNAYKTMGNMPGHVSKSGWEDPPYYVTAYGLAVKSGFKGTMEQWRESLAGVTVTKLTVREV